MVIGGRRHAVQLIDVDVVGIESAQRLVEARDDTLWRRMRIAKAERRLGGDYNLFPPHCLYRPAEYFFGAVSRRGVEEVDAELQRLLNYRNRIRLALAVRQT